MPPLRVTVLAAPAVIVTVVWPQVAAPFLAVMVGPPTPLVAVVVSGRPHVSGTKVTVVVAPKVPGVLGWHPQRSPWPSWSPRSG